MDDVYDYIGKSIRKTVEKQFGSSNPSLKMVQELILLDDGSQEFKIKIDTALEKLKEQNEKFKNEIDTVFSATLNEKGEVVLL